MGVCKFCSGMPMIASLPVRRGRDSTKQSSIHLLCRQSTQARVGAVYQISRRQHRYKQVLTAQCSQNDLNLVCGQKKAPTWSRFKVLGEGLEPSRLAAPEPKSGVSANFTTRALSEGAICSALKSLVNNELSKSGNIYYCSVGSNGLIAATMSSTLAAVLIWARRRSERQLRAISASVAR
jgi:hypothetical protein